MRRRLLLIASSPSDLVEMIDLADMMARRGHWVMMAYLCEGGLANVDSESKARLQALNNTNGRLQSGILDPSLTSRDKLVRSADLSFLPRDEANTPPPGLLLSALKKSARWFWANGLHVRVRQQILSALDALRKYRSALRRYLPNFYSLTAAAFVLRFYIRYLRVFRSELGRHSYQAVLIPEDVVGPIWPVLIKAAHEMGIPALVFPYTLANQKEAIQSLKDEPAFQSTANWWAARLFPRWRWRKGGYDLVRLPAAHIAAHEWLRISPPSPWLMNSGFSNAICVDSQASREYFVQAGIPPGKLVVTGSVSQDHLYSLIQSKEEGLDALRRELGLEGAKPVLLISGCPNQLAGKIPYCQFSSIEEIAEHIGRTVHPLRDSYHLIVRPHPNFQLFGEMLRVWGIVPTQIPTSRLVPLSDLFVAFASATIRWAIACAVPTINYDVFHYGYGDFSEAEGVKTLTDAEEFSQYLSAMVPGSEAYREAKALIQADAPYWSMMDGRCAEHIESAIDAECRKGRAQRNCY